MVGGVGEKVLQHHGEQVFAREALHHLAAVGRHRHGVAVVDHHRLDLGAERGRGLAQQVVADGAHVDDARQRPRHQVGPLQPGVVARGTEPARSRQQQPAAAVPPGAHQARQHRHQPGGVAAAAGTLHAVVQPDGGRRRGAVVARQLPHLVGRDAAGGGHALGRPLQRPLAQRRPTFDVTGDVVVVQPAVGHQLVHQPQRQRAVGARPQRDVLVALVGRLAAPRVDAHQPRAVALGLLGKGPEVQVRGDRVAAPDQDQPALGVVLDMHAHLGAVGGDQRLAAGVGADGAVQPRRTQPVEEARGHAVALHQAHGAGVAVGQDGLRVARGDGLQPGGDGVERLVPADGLEAAAALGAHAAQRLQHALAVIRALGIARHLGAQRAMRGRVLGVTGHADDAATLHRDLQRTGVGAVVRACALYDVGLVWRVHR